MDSLKIRIPFVWSNELKEPKNPDGIPDVLPITLGVDSETGLVYQKHSEEVSSALEAAYKYGSNFSGAMDDFGIGTKYAEDFISFVVGQIDDVAGKRILEIGCGTGYLLYRLEQLGASCIGVEPGPQGEYGKNKFGVNVVRDFFPTAKIDGKFDIIIFHSVLEHFESPSAFLNEVAGFLELNGKVFLSVPNCETYLRSGDISILLHEHYSYFTPDSLKRLALSSGWHSAKIQKSNFGSLLFACIQSGAPEAMNAGDFDDRELGSRFIESAKENLIRVRDLIIRLKDQGKSIGVFVPSRFINYVPEGGFNFEGIRFFDDNKMLKDTYFPGININVEGRQELLSNPPDIILIFSDFFGEKIKAEIQPLLPAQVHVIVWSEIFGV